MLDPILLSIPNDRLLPVEEVEIVWRDLAEFGRSFLLAGLRTFAEDGRFFFDVPFFGNFMQEDEEDLGNGDFFLPVWLEYIVE